MSKKHQKTSPKREKNQFWPSDAKRLRQKGRVVAWSTVQVPGDSVFPWRRRLHWSSTVAPTEIGKAPRQRWDPPMGKDDFFTCISQFGPKIRLFWGVRIVLGRSFKVRQPKFDLVEDSTSWLLFLGTKRWVLLERKIHFGHFHTILKTL